MMIVIIIKKLFYKSEISPLGLDSEYGAGCAIFVTDGKKIHGQDNLCDVNIDLFLHNSVA